jgi:hypothetical protein
MVPKWQQVLNPVPLVRLLGPLLVVLVLLPQVPQAWHKFTEWVNTHMFINNLFESPRESMPGYESEQDDQTTMKLSDLRKTRLTLAHLNRLRQASDIRKFEHEKNIQQIQGQYKAAPAAGAGGLGV